MKMPQFVFAALLICLMLCACTDRAAVATTDPTDALADTEKSAARIDPDPADPAAAEYRLLQNDAGKYIGVSFSFTDGSAYTWSSPVASELPFFIRMGSANDACVIDFYVGNGEWRFDWLDLTEKSTLYRHTNLPGKAYVFLRSVYENDSLSRESCVCKVESGSMQLRAGEAGNPPTVDYRDWHSNLDDGNYKNFCAPVAHVISGDTNAPMESDGRYTHLYSVIVSDWYTREHESLHADITVENKETTEVCEKPRLDGYATLYYFGGGVQVPEKQDPAEFRTTAAGYTAWYAGSDDTAPGKPDIFWVKMDEHFAVRLAAYIYDGDITLYHAYHVWTFIDSLFYY